MKPRDSSLPRPQRLPTPDSKDHHRHPRLTANEEGKHPSSQGLADDHHIFPLVFASGFWTEPRFGLAMNSPWHLDGPNIDSCFFHPKCTADRQTALSSVCSAIRRCCPNSLGSLEWEGWGAVLISLGAATSVPGLHLTFGLFQFPPLQQKWLVPIQHCISLVLCICPQALQKLCLLCAQQAL